MTKSYEDLLIDVKAEEFVKEVNVQDNGGGKDVKPKKIEPPTQEEIDAAPSRPINISFGSKKPEQNKQKLISSIESKGDFLQISDEKKDIMLAEKKEEEEINSMWKVAVINFGSLTEFTGSPFIKAREANLGDNEIKEVLSKASEYLESIDLNLAQEEKEQKEEILEEVNSI